ncbi:hypothetical protein SAMN02745751_00184 [Dethiosulfatibacter aminovorans DSM 17477]|uniref:Membrane transport protein n=1 Tax=Dethiosulfatibacter aminovorans DSM 17477 TaxID=1121476 RepID=A0A1M6ANC3_9FIRM|nr:AEC family transporter [Dethiosulfatibacter aminovorans]SHI37897.1 hypothetical protein SAMN02745751_00184 [Dethiosulfatibacter aminovorans DSM 17477]
MILATVVNSVLIMGFLIAIGFFLVKKGIITTEVEQAFTFMLLNIAIPALVIKSFNIEYSPEKMDLGFKVLKLAFLFTAGTVFLNHFILMKVKNIGKRKVMRYTNALTNCGFMGFPVVYQVYGAEGTFFASMFYVSVIFLMWTYGMSIFYDKFGKRELKGMLLNPNMISVYIGLCIFFFSIEIPHIVENMIDSVGGIITPLAMFIIGARIGRVRLSEMLSDIFVYLATFIKLVFFPLIMVFILSIIEMDPLIEGVCLIYASLPPPAIAVVIASQFNCEVDFSSKIVVMTHLFSLVTIPLMFAIFELL